MAGLNGDPSAHATVGSAHGRRWFFGRRPTKVSALALPQGPGVTCAGPEFDEYMRNFALLEAAAIAEGYTLQERVTAFRKLYYDASALGFNIAATGRTRIWRLLLPHGDVWSILIPGGARTPFPPGWLDAKLQDALQYLVEHKELIIGVEEVDMGHVFVGADAALRPTRISLGLGALRMRSNQEAVTYIGDIGGAVVEYIHHSGIPMPALARTRSQRLEFFYDSPEWGRSGPADVAGNADSYAIMFDPTRTLTDTLVGYYSSRLGGVMRRYARFTQAVGLGTLTDGGFSGDTPALRIAWQKETLNCALAYAVSTGRSDDLAKVLLKLGAGDGAPTYWELYWNVSGWVVDLFITRMTQAVQQEQAAAGRAHGGKALEEAEGVSA